METPDWWGCEVPEGRKRLSREEALAELRAFAEELRALKEELEAQEGRGGRTGRTSGTDRTGRERIATGRGLT